MSIIGTSGNDTITGTDGDDTLDGGTGADAMAGGLGNDSYIVDDVGDTIVEQLGAGTDTVVSSIEITLGDNLENLTLTGKALKGAGNGLDNVLQANAVFLYHVGPNGGMGHSATQPSYDVYAGSDLSGGDGNDTLIASGARDTLAGGLGNDVYEIHNSPYYENPVQSTVVENDSEGVDEVRVFSSQPDGYFLSDNVENLTLMNTGFGMPGGHGNKLDNVIKGSDGGNSLYGEGGSDTLWGSAGNDTLTGGSGNDVLTGGADADTYLFASGDGQDTVHADSQDTLSLDAGVLRTDLLVGLLGATGPDTVVLSFKGRTDTITLDNAGQWDGLTLSMGGKAIGLTGADLLAIAKRSPGLNLSGTSGKDALKGGVGNDTLSGLAGNDTLSGGVLGNDRLIGGKGNDTYLFSRGDGQDTIVDQDATWFNSDLLTITGAQSNQLWLTRSGNNLDISVIGTSDKVTIEGWYASSNNRVEKITAADDAKSLSASKVNALVTAMAGFTPPAQGQTTLPADVQASLTKVLASSWA